MMPAEIGSPPGAEVDLSSLESLIEDGSLGIEHYEVLPDRVILLPAAGGRGIVLRIFRKRSHADACEILSVGSIRLSQSGGPIGPASISVDSEMMLCPASILFRGMRPKCMTKLPRKSQVMCSACFRFGPRAGIADFP
jgi:hypothetical protein